MPSTTFAVPTHARTVWTVDAFIKHSLSIACARVEWRRHSLSITERSICSCWDASGVAFVCHDDLAFWPPSHSNRVHAISRVVISTVEFGHTGLSELRTLVVCLLACRSCFATDLRLARACLSTGRR